MDVLYVVGPKKDDFALRMSLRSLEAHAAHADRIVMAGDPPEWASDDVVRVPCDSPCARKQMNILRAVLRAMETGALEGPCLYSSDDHFVLRDCDLDDFPWFSNGRLPSYEFYATQGKQITPYRGSLAATHDLLKYRGYPHDLKMSGHVDTHMDARDLKEVSDLAGEYWRTPFGYEPSELFAAVARKRDPSLATVRKYDAKIMQCATVSYIESELAKGGGFLSCSPASLLAGDLKGWLLSRFPVKSRWEK